MKNRLKECFDRNYPTGCPRGGDFVETKVISGGQPPKFKTRHITYCKYYSHCNRLRKKWRKK